MLYFKAENSIKNNTGLTQLPQYFVGAVLKADYYVFN